jgi:hypothetical protein
MNGDWIRMSEGGSVLRRPNVTGHKGFLPGIGSSALGNTTALHGIYPAIAMMGGIRQQPQRGSWVRGYAVDSR